MNLTERDIEIIKFINTFGFCEMPQIEKRFNLKKPRNYQLVSRLVEKGLLKHERIFHGRHGIFRATDKGAKYTELPPLHRVIYGNYKHDLLVIELYLKLRQLHPEAQWVSERELKRDKYFDGVGKRGHLPDGMLLFPVEGKPEKKQIVVELELTLKGKNRMEGILKGYTANFSIDEVWYYCSGDIVESVRLQAENARVAMIKVYNVNELLNK